MIFRLSEGLITSMKEYFKLLRIKHYLKNVLVLIPIFFNQTLFDTTKITNGLLGFLSFCMISSAVYIVNDIHDVDKDRNHPSKRFRPIASGAISISKAKAFGAFCLIISIVISILTKSFFSSILLLLYFALNVAYSVSLKNKPILDVVILASGFVLRIAYGAYLTNVRISGWLYLTAWMGALYMGLGKRRNELRKSSTSDETRPVLKYYNYSFLDKNMYVCIALASVFYALWAVGHDDQRFLWSFPIVLIIYFKYSLDIEGDSDGDPIEVILHDITLLILVAILAIYLFYILYI